MVLNRCSPVIHLIHIPKTAGNSIWRQLITDCDDAAYNPDHNIKLDSRNFVDVDYWEKLYSKSNIREYQNNTIFDPQIGLGILGNKEINFILKKKNFLEMHRILIHHHNSGVLRLPINSDIGNETSSHIWRLQNCPYIFVLTLRDTMNRTISHFKHSFRSNITEKIFKEQLKTRAIWNGGCDSDFMPRDRRPIFDMISIKLRKKELSINDAINWAIEILPEIATYQLRYILTLICSKNPTHTLEILWLYSNEIIKEMWEEKSPLIQELLDKNKLGSIYLDPNKKFKSCKNFNNFLSKNYDVLDFKVKQTFKKTASPNQANFQEIKIDNNIFMKYASYEQSILENFFF